MPDDHDPHPGPCHEDQGGRGPGGAAGRETDGHAHARPDGDGDPDRHDDGERDELAARILGPLARRQSTATVLFHQAMADRLGLGPSDHKCLDLLLERGPMTGSQLAAVTGVTTGAITGVVSRLERAGYLRRERDPDDGRKQLLMPSPEGLREIGRIFEGARRDPAALLEGFDTEELAVIARFLDRATAYAYEQIADLRASVLRDGL